MGSLGTVLARLGCILGCQEVSLRWLGVALEASWGHLKTFCEDLGRVLASLDSLLGFIWEHVWTIFCHLKLYAKIGKNLGKPMVFH